MKDCYSRTALVARRLISTVPAGATPFLPNLPLPPGSPLVVPIEQSRTDMQAGDTESPPHQYWVTAVGETAHVNERLVVVPGTFAGGSHYPVNSFARVRVQCDSEKASLVFDHDMRGVLVTPPTSSVSVQLLAPEGAVRLDSQPGRLDADSNAPLVQIDRVSLAMQRVGVMRQPDRHNADGGLDAGALAGAMRLTRAATRPSIVDRWGFNSAVNQAGRFYPFPPWARRFRWRATMVAGNGTVIMVALYWADGALSKGLGEQIEPTTTSTASTTGTTSSAWHDASGLVGIQPVTTGPATDFVLAVEVEGEV